MNRNVPISAIVLRETGLLTAGSLTLDTLVPVRLNGEDARQFGDLKNAVHALLKSETLTDEELSALEAIIARLKERNPTK